MIPHKLTVRNFMCYRDDVAPLHFDGINVVCLSGDNGAGKSALLDAITWALWGRARAKSDDDLIALGAEDMEVDFEFELDGTMRRVIRRRSKGKRGQTIVDFQVQDGDGTWRRISGDGVRDTEAQIVAALRMSYDTFINSAFLLQGRADEFTTRKPTERKQVLADILGLADYEELEARAKARRATCDAGLHNLEGLIADHEAQVARRPFLLQERDAKRGRAGEIDAEVMQLETKAQALRAEAERLRQLAATRAALEARIAQHERELGDVRQEIATAEVQIEAAEAVLLRRPEIEAGMATLAHTEARLVEFEHLREEAYRLNDEKKVYDEALAQIRLRLEAERDRTDGDVQRLRAQAERHPELERTEAELASEAKGYARLRDDLGALREEQAVLEERQQQITTLRMEVADLEQPLKDMRQALLVTQTNYVRSLEALDKSVGRLPALERELRAARWTVAELDHADEQLAAARSRAADAATRRASMVERYAGLEREGKNLKEKLALIRTGEGVCPTCGSTLDGGQDGVEATYEAMLADLRVEYRATKAALDEAEGVLHEATPEVERLGDLVKGRPAAQKREADLVAQVEQALADRDRMHDEQRSLESVDAQLANNDYGHPERVRLHDAQHRLAQFGDAQEVRNDLDRVRKRIAATETSLRGEQDLHRRQAAIAEQVRAAGAAAAELVPSQRRLAELETQLREERYGEAERAASAKLLAEIKALGYTRAEHEALRNERQDLLQWTQQYAELERAEALVPPLRLALQRQRELAERHDADLRQERAEETALGVQLQGRQATELALGDTERGLRTMKERQSLAHQELGRAEADVHRCEQVEELLGGYRAQYAQLAEQRGIFDELVQAFGKKGVQAMLIETAIPELEHEANDLLGRMTDNQMHLRFETQRDSKKGDTLETLEIKISDGLGTRDYSMFSGGEAFRVNFAVRIALSKLLAKRADANLKTLVIDEGFGTQDGRGRDRVVEAINTVAPDFERIVVITHIQELKDLFPHHIEVTKGAAGSTWSIV
jgi:DNA repair protein SbcC/Rad50